MPLLYGEGKKWAFIRLFCEIQIDQESNMPPGLEQALSSSMSYELDAALNSDIGPASDEMHDGTIVEE